MKRKKRVIVGMSGGVDSSVAAALLKKQGHDVIGMTMQLLPKDGEKESACCNLGSINDAKRVASKLGITHYTINSRAPFQEKVINYFVSQYMAGFTPNPCVECNRHIKFDELKKRAEELGADYVATGNYCQRSYSSAKKTYFLKKAKDNSKDQSYFLYMLSAEQLQSILFPLGGFLKSEIREIARELNLVNADKPDSQEICFVTQKSYKDFIKGHLGESEIQRGNIVDTSGKKLGEHDGIYQFTIGQRKGLNISAVEPLYVLKIDAKSHSVVVGRKEDLQSKNLTLKTFSQVNAPEDLVGRTFDMKLRYQMTPHRGTVLSADNGEATIEMLGMQSFVSPGQSCVLYDRDRVAGGGIISL